MPSLEKARLEVEKLDHTSAKYWYTKAAIYNELGRVFEMTSALDVADERFKQAHALGTRVPSYRPLHMEIMYNLSAVDERKNDFRAGCKNLRRAADLYADLVAHPAEPPEGYGKAGEHFLRAVAGPKIQERSDRMNCGLSVVIPG